MLPYRKWSTSMSEQSSNDFNPELWAGIVTIMPVILLYLRSILAELGKATAQAIWRFIVYKRHSRPTVLVIVLRESDPSIAIACQETNEKLETLRKHQ